MPRQALTRILHVDDEADIRTVTRMVFESIGGFVVESCDSGATALKRVGNFKPDLIVLDVMMPGMDGHSTLRALQNSPETAKIPVVILTAVTQPDGISTLQTKGVLDVIFKPFEPLELVGRVREIWNRAYA